MGQRLDRLHQIEALDPERDGDEIYRLHALYEFPWDVTRALELALYRHVSGSEHELRGSGLAGSGADSLGAPAIPRDRSGVRLSCRCHKHESPFRPHVVWQLRRRHGREYTLLLYMRDSSTRKQSCGPARTYQSHGEIAQSPPLGSDGGDRHHPGRPARRGLANDSFVWRDHVDGFYHGQNGRRHGRGVSPSGLHRRAHRLAHVSASRTTRASSLIPLSRMTASSTNQPSTRTTARLWAAGGKLS